MIFLINTTTRFFQALAFAVQGIKKHGISIAFRNILVFAPELLCEME